MMDDFEDMDSIVQDFIIESNELLEKYESDLLQLEKTPDDDDLLNSIFRSAHTIKGSASFLGFDVLTELTHHAEDLLNKLRKHELKLTDEIVDVLFEVMDGMKNLLAQISAGEEETFDIKDTVAKVEALASGKSIADSSNSSEAVQEKKEPQALPNYLQDEVLKDVLKEFVIEAEENLESFSEEMVNWEKHKDNKDILNDLYRKIHTVKGSAGFLGIDNMAELAHKIEDIMSKIRDGKLTLNAEMVDAMLEGTDKLVAIVKMLKEFKVPDVDVKDTINKLLSFTGESKKVEEKKKDAPKAKPSVPVEKKSASTLVKEKGVEQTIRVDVKRLDELMNLVGELVQAKNRLIRIRQEVMGQYEGDTVEKLVDNISNMDFITSELQMAVMKTRLLPIGKVFNKYPRMVRTLAKESNKEIDLVISCEETELDKSIIELIGDPLVHLLRNSADHGIEPPEERERLGKPRTGTIYLSAYQEGDNIIIEIEDDGRGMDAQKIANKAIEKGLIDEATLRTMSQSEIINLIFLPGFSTAEKVSNISGRGVGMDVVRSNIQKLNGTIEVTTELGKGSKIKIKLPLTLAIVTALLVVVADEIYSVPITSVLETIKISKKEIKTINGKEVLNLRDIVLPLVRLSDVFDVPNADRDKDSFYVVIVGIGDKKMGLVVDELLGREEIVIKSLSEYLGNIKGIAGASTLGDGKVSLILDISGLDKLAS